MPLCVCLGIGELLALGAIGLFTLMGSLLGWEQRRKAKKEGCCDHEG
jgi:hypothetical protein